MLRNAQDMREGEGESHLHPRLLVQVRHVKLHARRVRQLLVVFLQDFVEALHPQRWFSFQAAALTIAVVNIMRQCTIFAPCSSG